MNLTQLLLFAGLAAAQEALAPVTGPKGQQPQTMPAMGFGTWYLRGSNATEAVASAIEAGYRLIDCAYIYMNQRDVGAGIREGIKRAGITRKDLWITTKLWNSQHSDAQAGLRENLSQLGLDYVDLFLVHWPQGSSGFDPVETWKRMEALPATNKVRFIGISNHNPAQVDAVLKVATIKPKVHQIELHPYLPQQDFVDKLKSEGMIVNAYAPLANTNTHYSQKTTKILQHPTIKDLAISTGCTPAQIVLAWNMLRGIVPIPKAAVVAHAKENLGAEACAKKLSGSDTAKIDAISTAKQYRFNDMPCATMGGKCWDGLVRGS